MSKSRLISVLLVLVGVACGWGLATARSQGAAHAAEKSPKGVFGNFAPVVIDALKKRELSGNCPMCGKNQWVVHEVPVSLPVYEEGGQVKFPGTSMPMAAMICKNCGFTSLHALGPLGLLNKVPPAPATAPASTGPKFAE